MAQHFIFTKFNMPGFPGDPHIDPEWLEGRIDLFKKWLLPSMKQQTCQDFKWIMHCSAKTPLDMIYELSAIENEYDNLELIYINDENWYPEWLAKIRDRVEPGDLLTIRIDSDDAVLDEFVEITQKGKTTPLEKGHFLSYQFGVMHNTQTGKYYARQYPKNPFMTYYETSFSDAPRDIVTVHNRQHCHAEPLNAFCRDLLMWVQNVHGGNQGNRYNPPNGKEYDFADISKDYIGE